MRHSNPSGASHADLTDAQGGEEPKEKPGFLSIPLSLTSTPDEIEGTAIGNGPDTSIHPS